MALVERNSFCVCKWSDWEKWLALYLGTSHSKMLFLAQQRTQWSNFAYHRQHTWSSHDGALDPENVSARGGIFKICISQHTWMPANSKGSLSARKFAKCLREQMFFYTLRSKVMLQSEKICPVAARLAKQRLMRHLSSFAAPCQCSSPSFFVHGMVPPWIPLSSPQELAYPGSNPWKCGSRREFPA